MQTINLSKKFSIYRRSILVIALIVIICLLQSCHVHKRGAATPDRIVEQYLLALENKDEKLLLQLAPEDAVFTKEIETKVSRIGGYKIQDIKIHYFKSTPMLWSAKIQGGYIDRQGKNRNFEDSIVIQYQSKGELKLYAGRWYILLEGMK
jgi:hypothetical protein